MYHLPSLLYYSSNNVKSWFMNKIKIFIILAVIYTSLLTHFTASITWQRPNLFDTSVYPFLLGEKIIFIH